MGAILGPFSFLFFSFSSFFGFCSSLLCFYILLVHAPRAVSFLICLAFVLVALLATL